MPKKKEKKDPSYDMVPGYTRKAQGYDPAKDKRGIKKELMKIKGKGLKFIIREGLRYQPSGPRATRSPPATPHCLRPCTTSKI